MMHVIVFNSLMHHTSPFNSTFLFLLNVARFDLFHLRRFVNNNNNNMAARRAENRSVKDSIETINSVQHNHTGFRIFNRYVPFACTPVEICFSYFTPHT